MKNNRGFTLIELLVVIAIIGMLSAIVLASLSVARQKGNDSAAKSELVQFRTAFEIYLESHNTYPPNTDSCSACTNPCDAVSWNAVVSALKTSNSMSNPPATDPWGRPWCYDNNYDVNTCTLPTAIWSMGKNGSSESSVNGPAGDDIWIPIAAPSC